MRKPHQLALVPLIAVAFALVPSSAGAAYRSDAGSLVAPGTVITVSSTPLDPITGRVIGRTKSRTLTPAQAATLTAVMRGKKHVHHARLTGLNMSGWWGTPSAGGRMTFRLDVTHNIACFFGFCVGSYRHVTDADVSWVAAWHWVGVNAWAKYTPIGNSYMHYGGQSQTFGGDFRGFYTDRFRYRGTAQNVLNIPMVGEAYLQDSNDMTVYYNGMMSYTVKNA